MSTDRHIVEFLEALKRHRNNQSILVATVKNVSPFSLSMYDVTITDHIYINDDTKFKTGDTVVVFQSGISFYVIERVVKVA